MPPLRHIAEQVFDKNLSSTEAEGLRTFGRERMLLPARFRGRNLQQCTSYSIM